MGEPNEAHYYWSLYGQDFGSADDIKSLFAAIDNQTAAADVAAYCLSKWENVPLHELTARIPNKFAMLAIGRRGPRARPAIDALTEGISIVDDGHYRFIQALREISTSIDDFIQLKDDILFSDDVRTRKEILRWVGSLARKAADGDLNIAISSEGNFSNAIRLLSASTIDGDLEIRRHAFVTVQNFNSTNAIHSKLLQKCIVRMSRQLPFIFGSYQAEAFKGLVALCDDIDLIDSLMCELFGSGSSEVQMEMAGYVRQRKSISRKLAEILISFLDRHERKFVEIALLSIGKWMSPDEIGRVINCMEEFAHEEYFALIACEALRSFDVNLHLNRVQHIYKDVKSPWVRARMIDAFNLETGDRGGTYLQKIASRQL